MDFGIALAPAADSWKTVQRAEALGFSHAWLYDTQLLCADVFVAMALAAANTRRITIGPGVLVPSNRIAPVAANGLASLNKLAPDRIARPGRRSPVASEPCRTSSMALKRRR